MIVTAHAFRQNVFRVLFSRRPFFQIDHATPQRGLFGMTEDTPQSPQCAASRPGYCAVTHGQTSAGDQPETRALPDGHVCTGIGHRLHDVKCRCRLFPQTIQTAPTRPGPSQMHDTTQHLAGLLHHPGHLTTAVRAAHQGIIQNTNRIALLRQALHQRLRQGRFRATQYPCPRLRRRYLACQGTLIPLHAIEFLWTVLPLRCRIDGSDTAPLDNRGKPAVLAIQSNTSPESAILVP